MTVEVASSEQVFGLQASRPPRATFLASAFTGYPIGFAAPRSQTERQHMEVCSLLPQRDCCRISRHSLFLRRNAFKELVGRVPSLGRPSIKEEKIGEEFRSCEMRRRWGRRGYLDRADAENNPTGVNLNSRATFALAFSTSDPCHLVASIGAIRYAVAFF
jgi:hypothetical protein